MKISYWLTTVICLIAVARCTSSVSLRRSAWATKNDAAIDLNTAESLDATSDLPNEALLELTEEDDATVQNRVLLSKLRVQERAAAWEREALQVQQEVLIRLQQNQQSLEARAAAMELREAAISSERIAMGRVSIGHQVPPIIRHVITEKPHRFSLGRTTINVTETEDQYWDRQNKTFIAHAEVILSYMLTTVLVAFLYMNVITKSVGPKLPDHEIRTDEFQFGAFECSDVGRDWYICLCGWCCDWVRWADTASHPQIDFLAFWPALFITAVLASTATITFGFTIPILLLIVVYCRQRIRLAYGLPAGTFSVLAWDCCLWTCCPCCAIVQEARQVEYVESRLVPDYEDKTSS